MSPNKDGCYIPSRADVLSHTALEQTEDAGQLFHAAASVQNLTATPGNGTGAAEPRQCWLSAPKATGPRSSCPHSHFSLINIWTAGRVYYSLPTSLCNHTRSSTALAQGFWKKTAHTPAQSSWMAHLPGEVHETKIAQAHSKLFTLNNEKERRLWEQTCCSLHWVMCQPWRAVSKQVLPSTTSPCEAGRCSIAAAQPSCPRKKQVPCRSRNIWPTGSWRHSICQQERQTKCYWQQRVGGETSEICHIKAAWHQYYPLHKPPGPPPQSCLERKRFQQGFTVAPECFSFSCRRVLQQSPAPCLTKREHLDPMLAKDAQLLHCCFFSLPPFTPGSLSQTDLGHFPDFQLISGGRYRDNWFSMYFILVCDSAPKEGREHWSLFICLEGEASKIHILLNKEWVSVPLAMMPDYQTFRWLKY